MIILTPSLLNEKAYLGIFFPENIEPHEPILFYFYSLSKIEKIKILIKYPLILFLEGLKVPKNEKFNPFFPYHF